MGAGSGPRACRRGRVGVCPASRGWGGWEMRGRQGRKVLVYFLIRRERGLRAGAVAGESRRGYSSSLRIANRAPEPYRAIGLASRRVRLRPKYPDHPTPKQDHRPGVDARAVEGRARDTPAAETVSW
ncbi:hypothetical protein NN3_03670 [Nocardia neocaledoniensis NBRC 108232]|nr:hypothetical protein NN3_03670 [Nocardia neocaledoniensis NBRC 108232]